MRKKHKGFLFTFEGGEAAGKGTQIKLLSDKLKKEGYTVSQLKFYEPGGTKFADTLRIILKKRIDTEYAKKHFENTVQLRNFDLDPLSQAFLFLSARSHQFINSLKKELDSGNIVLLDRSIDSTTVYQGHAQNPDLIKLIRMANDSILNSAKVKIDKTFYLDIPSLIAKSRVNSRNGATEKDFFDEKPVEFFEAIRKGYLSEWAHCRTYSKEHPHFERIELIDGTRKQNVIHDEILKLIKKCMH